MRSLQLSNPLHALAACCIAVLLTACGSAPMRAPEASKPTSTPTPTDIRSEAATEHGSEIAIYALDMIGTGYRFGGKNPDAGFDCSGMVSYIFNRAAGLKLSGSAADMARQGRQIDKSNLRPGDLVFFNTLNRPFSHVGIYIGDGRFVHAPSGNGKVHISRMDNPYFAPRFEMARAYFN
ncbi:peptidoglycan endopeptidase [Herbaspirillum lusitanum]|uniref:C40 family peptidase n=1 Tax=Herbaspirillum lusitanum TaxID=213312 RepID=UPI00223842C9|nr:C40 family peptidase [Herbaspirillum lusitanum]MCW5298095.1 peptidoglycan endopeptidase [Herbaspirillum lusitanum]